jgi:hypothetical protein
LTERARVAKQLCWLSWLACLSWLGWLTWLGWLNWLGWLSWLSYTLSNALISKAILLR